jgi:alkanesulfonate monooxygenase SsuD/methylene tetrahydromethanopterin reductase-like flavin-dependent oxidoreductase (luciferase family)
MKFGLKYYFRNPAQWQRPWPELYGRVIQQVAWAEQSGFSLFNVSEHHFVEDGYAPSLFPVCGAVAARTASIQIEPCVIALPFHHPVRVAEDAAIVDIISNGRLALTVGGGYRRAEFDGFGIPPKQRAGRMDEALEIVKRCWTEDTFSFEGRHFNLKDICVTPKPVSRPHPPLYVAVSSEAAARRAARWADGIRGASDSVWDAYASELRALGRPVPARPQRIPQPRFLHVTDDPDRDWQRIAPHAAYENDSYADFFAGTPQDGMWPRFEDFDALKASGMYLVSTPEQARELLRRVQQVDSEATFFLNPILPGMDLEMAEASLQLFASKVIPEFLGAEGVDNGATRTSVA